MHGDTAAVRHLAGRLDEQAELIRTTATALVRAATDAPWRGRGADAMRRGAFGQAGDMRAAATAHEEAAAALRLHALQVEETRALVARVERLVHDLVAGARERLAGAAGAVAGALGEAADTVGDAVGDAVGSAADRALDAFDPPGPGSLDWLSVDLPGLDLPGLDAWRAAA